MNFIRHLTAFFECLEKDERLGAYHISLYISLFFCWNRNRFRNPFPVDRDELMWLSRIGSRNTYARCMKELDAWGYIQYSSTGNFHTGRKVSCTHFDTGNNTGTNTGKETGESTGSKTGRGTSIKNINFTNITNRNKQKPSLILENGKGKKVNGKSIHHVNPDKDYSEPL